MKRLVIIALALLAALIPAVANASATPTVSVVPSSLANTDADAYHKPFCGTGWDWTETAPRMIVHADKSCVEVPIENKASFSITTSIGGAMPYISSGYAQGSNGCPSAADQADGLCNLYPVQLNHEGEPLVTISATLKPGYAGNVAMDDYYSPVESRASYSDRCSSNLADAYVEVMVWFAHPGDLAGKYSYTTWLDGRKWQVETWETTTGCPKGEGWRLLIFMAPRTTDGTVTVHNVKLNVFTGWAIAHHMMTGKWYLDSINAGFEEKNKVAGESIDSYSLTGGAK